LNDNAKEWFFMSNEGQTSTLLIAPIELRTECRSSSSCPKRAAQSQACGSVCAKFFAMFFSLFGHHHQATVSKPRQPLAAATMAPTK
jgi:hypothetical protein